MIKEEAGKLHDEAKERLLCVIGETDNVTLLKKIIASGELAEEAFDRLVDIAFDDPANGDALLEVMVLCKKSGKMKEHVNNRMGWVKEK